MPKNIIICSDGTGNTAIKDRGTNVFKLFESIDLNGHRSNPALTAQIALYDDGVGTNRFLLLKLLGGAFGWGLKRNVLKLYTGLVRIYDPGDRIFLFGFSRGAFTIRALAGLIAKCGILDWEWLADADEMRTKVLAAYNTYRRSYRTWLWRVLHGKNAEEVRISSGTATSDFKAEEHCYDADIHFIGVWDTVDSVGGPFHISDVINTFLHRFKFPDQMLSDKVRYAVQALSIDDARAAFEPRLWEAREGLEQVWFAGVHCNVGGGYPKQGMSLVTLDWMMQKAEERGLRILARDRELYREHCSVDDKLYDSRAGLGALYRWKLRDMRALCEGQKAGLPKIHLSAFERIAYGTDGYAPGTISEQVDVVYTPTGSLDQDRTLKARADVVCSVLARAFSTGAEHLESVRGTLLLGRLAYYLSLTSLLALVLTGSVIRTTAGSLKYWNVVVLSTLVVLCIVSACASAYVNHRRNVAFSRFWHKPRHELRRALKQAREERLRDKELGTLSQTDASAVSTITRCVPELANQSLHNKAAAQRTRTDRR